MKVTKEQARKILKELKKNDTEYRLYKELLNRSLNEGLSSETLDKIVKGWKNLSMAFLASVVMTPALAADLKDYSPETYAAIEKKVAATTGKDKVIKTIDFSQPFKSGAKELTNSEGIRAQLEDLQKWANANSGTKFKITIVASESQVTNPKGFEGEKSLAQARANALKQLVSQVYKGPIETKTLLGDKKYVQGKDKADDPKYTKDQFVRIEISVLADDLCSFQPKEKDIKQGDAVSHYITFDKVVSGEGHVTITPGKIPDRLVILDANGNVTQDTGYITTTKSSYPHWKYVPQYVYELTKASLDPKQEGMKGVTKIHAESIEELIKQIANVDNPERRGNEIEPFLDQLKILINKNKVHDFVIYDNMGSGRVPFSDAKGDVRAVVYSPISNTGYDLVGDCH